MRFKFDPQKPPGHRIGAGNVWTVHADACHPLDLHRKYTVATKHYLTSGKDGFDCLKDQKVIVDDDTGPLLPTLASNVFTELDILNYLGHSEQRARRALAKLRPRAHAIARTPNTKDLAEDLWPQGSHVSIHHPQHGRHVIAPACDGCIQCLAA